MKKIRFKFTYIIIYSLIGLLSIGCISGAFASWVFSFKSEQSSSLKGNVLVEDIKENYNFIPGTQANPNTFDKKDSELGEYTYKLLGGYNNASNHIALNYNTNTTTLTEFNFVCDNDNKSADSSGKWVDTVKAGLGRFYYLDRLYVNNKEGAFTSIGSYSGTFKKNNSNQTFTFNSLNLKAKQSGYAISRVKTNDLNNSSVKKNSTDNWLYVFDQDDIFKQNYSSLSKNESQTCYNWLTTYLLANINNYMNEASLSFYFDKGNNNKTKDDNLSKFNDEFDKKNNNHSEYNIATNEETYQNLNDYSIDVNTQLNRKYFASKIRGYANLLLFVPFKRDYSNPNTSLSSTNDFNYYPPLKDSNGNYIEENFGFVAFCDAISNSNSENKDNKISSFIKIIDFSDITTKGRANGAKPIVLPSLTNGGFVLDSEGYFDYSKNFADNGNLFLDYTTEPDYEYVTSGTVSTVVFKPKARYRRVIGISLNLDNRNNSYYYEPGYKKDNDKALGDFITTLYSSYPDPFNVHYNTEKNDWDEVLDASSLEEAKKYKAKDAGGNNENVPANYNLEIKNLITVDENGNYLYQNQSMKLVDHLTFEEVDISETYYEYIDGDGTTQSSGNKNEFGINFNKSMILLLVNKDVDISYTKGAKVDRDNNTYTYDE